MALPPARPPARSARRTFELLGLVAILSLAAYLRLANRAANPGWYTDEGTHLDITRHLLQGQVQYLAINKSFLLFARLPPFELLLAGVSGLSGGGIGTLRGLTGGLGVASVGMLYWLVRAAQQAEGQRDRLPLLAALLLAIYPQAVVYSRFGFSYNLLTPLLLLAGLGLFNYSNTGQRRWLALAALAVGVGAVSDLWMMVLTPLVLLVILTRRWRDGLWASPLLATPFGLYVAAMLLRAPAAFWFDLRYTLSRLSALPPTQQLVTLAGNCATLIAHDVWMAAAVPGLLTLRPARLRQVSLLLFGLPILILGRSVALYSLSFYYMIPLLPFVALGVASLIRSGVGYIRRTLGSNAALLLGGVMAALLGASLARTFTQVQTGFETPIDIFLINPDDARAVATFVNERAGANDVIIASPAVAWLLQANATDFQMAVAAAGQATVHLPAAIPADRFAFDPGLAHARFVVVDNLWRNWGAVHMPEVAALMRAAERWPVAFQSGQITVYRNPAR
ncbi:MAG: glycosyltransferase family 39 protein [Anaerolineales bacterium]